MRRVTPLERYLTDLGSLVLSIQSITFIILRKDTKHSELAFRALLDEDGTREVCFKRTIMG